MFTAYAEDLGYLGNGLHHYQYFCEECDQAFCSAWGKIPGSMSQFERGSYFTCPYCGHRHQANVAYVKRDEVTPNKMRLAVKEYKDIVALEVSSETVIFKDYLQLDSRKYKEVFRFDTVKQTVSLTTYNKGTVELGNPFKLEMFESILSFLRPNSLANLEQKLDLNNILKVLRETVHRKLEKHLGHKVSSMFVSPGQYHGTFLLPIFNMAYRAACPDAPNLPIKYRESPEIIRDFWKSKMLNSEPFNIALMDHVIAFMRRGKDFVTAIIKTTALPDKTFVRRTLSKDLFSANVLAKSFDLCKNYDLAIRLYEGLIKIGNDGRLRWMVKDELFQFLNEIISSYGEAGIVRLVEEAEGLQTYDCMRLYQQLNAANKKALEVEGVRLRNLHDWMSLRHKMQTHVNMKFDVPDHIIKRLSMQTDRLKFFMPKESMELLEAGHELHNCVASYGKAMKDNTKWIVLVADDKGKLAVCLEIKGNELIQAKINKNNPVSSDIKLNSAVLAWAKEANIKIKTSDIRVPVSEKLEKTG